MMSSIKEEDERHFIEKAAAWDSDGAKLIFRLMKQTGDSIIARSKEISNDIESLLQSTQSAQSRLNNAINDLYLASNNQFIESQVDEEDDPIYDPNVYSIGQISLTDDSSSVVDPNHVLSCTMKFINENQYQQFSSENPISLVPSLGKYSHRKLPFIIGSKEFKENDDIGLKENVLRPSPPAPPPPPPLPPLVITSSKLIKNDETHESLSHGSSSTTSAFSSSKDEEITSTKEEDVPTSSLIEDVPSSNLMDALCAEIRGRKGEQFSSSSSKSKDTHKSIFKGRGFKNDRNTIVGSDLLSGDRKPNEECFKKCDTNVTDENVVVSCNDKVVGVTHRIKSIFSSDEEDDDLFSSKGLASMNNNNINTQSSSSSGNTKVDCYKPKPNNLNSLFREELLSKVNKQSESNEQVKGEKIKNMESQSSAITRIDDISDDRGDSLLKSSINSKSRSIFDDETDDEDDLFSKAKSFSKLSSQNYKRRSSTPKELTQNTLTTSINNNTKSQSIKAKNLFDNCNDDSLFKPKMKSNSLTPKSNINQKEVEVNHRQSNDSSSQEPKKSLIVPKTSSRSGGDIQSVLHDASNANNDSLSKVSNDKGFKSNVSAFNSIFDSDDDDFDSLFNSKVQSAFKKSKPQTDKSARIEVAKEIVKDQKFIKTTNNGNLLVNKTKNKGSLFDDDDEDDLFECAVQIKSLNRKTRLSDESDDDDNILFGGSSKKSLNNFKKIEIKDVAQPQIIQSHVDQLSEENVVQHEKVNDSASGGVFMSNAVKRNVIDDLNRKEIEPPSDSEENPQGEQQLSSLSDNSSTSLQQMDKSTANRSDVKSDPGRRSRNISSSGEGSPTKRISSQLQDQLTHMITKRHSSAIDKGSYSSPKENETNPTSSSSLLVGLTKSRPKIISKRRLPSRHMSQTSRGNNSFIDLNISLGTEVDVKPLKEDAMKVKASDETSSSSSNCAIENKSVNKNLTNVKDENDPYFAAPPPLKLFDSSSSEDEIFT
ncbi:unnamed protein product [Lepeophtheirus salmonis]|uniref:(salmon louse) hypothetical protein n=1 Tax=Lepeophtheirus salmonis TaxID=72036 RepID=A0A7R8H785_LEPSM|nr:unnamed protein product [Lepeophtheirus salmonis]CAF2918443.1 unnamed protein product [Lepeophtheirus salmonis]